MLSEDSQQFTDAIRKAREARGWSQADLGSRLGVSQSRISKIERGAVDLRLSTLVAVARVLGLEPVLVPQRLLPLLARLSEGDDREQRPRYRIDNDE